MGRPVGAGAARAARSGGGGVGAASGGLEERPGPPLTLPPTPVNVGSYAESRGFQSPAGLSHGTGEAHLRGRGLCEAAPLLKARHIGDLESPAEDFTRAARPPPIRVSTLGSSRQRHSTLGLTLLPPISPAS